MERNEVVYDIRFHLIMLEMISSSYNKFSAAIVKNVMIEYVYILIIWEIV
jgi:hypothetical protein